MDASTCDCKSSRSAPGRCAPAAAWKASSVRRRGVPRVAASARKYSSSMPKRKAESSTLRSCRWRKGIGGATPAELRRGAGVQATSITDRTGA